MTVADVAVILAAGGSTRMGRPKACLDWGGMPLVRAHVEALRPHVDVVVVVEGAVRLAELLPGVEVCRNDEWARTWPVDSLRVALEGLPNVRSVLVTPVDVVPTTAATVRALAEARSAVPCDSDGRDGHPVVVREPELSALRQAAPDGGLRSLLATATRVPVSAPHVAVDFDDAAAFAACRRAVLGS